MQFWALVVDSFRESLDRKIFWVLLTITLLIVATMASVGFHTDHISFLFGLWDIHSSYYNPLSLTGRSHILGLIVYMLTFTFLGWIGVILMIIAMAGVFPRLLESGSVDLLLSKPMSRWKLFGLKYVASMVFVFMQATLFVGLTFLVMGLRWRLWVPGYLLSIPLLVLLFSYVYCVTVLSAVKTGSTVTSILLSLVAWFVFAAPSTVLQTFESFPELKEYTRLYRVVRLASWIPPKTAEIPYLAARWAHAGTSLQAFPSSVMNTGISSDQETLRRAQEMEERALRTNPVWSIGSSLLFEGVIVWWAMWSFARKDY